MEEIKGILDELQYKVDSVEDLVDELEDNGVDVEGLRNSLASFWTEYHSLAEDYE